MFQSGKCLEHTTDRSIWRVLPRPRLHSVRGSKVLVRGVPGAAALRAKHGQGFVTPGALLRWQLMTNVALEFSRRRVVSQMWKT